MSPVPSTSGISARTRSVAFCGLTVALMAVSAWVSIPIGQVPVTLQTFVMVLALLVLKPKEFFISLVVYIAIGAIGLPVFAGMRGGLGVIMGPTGGFLWGFILGGGIALLFLWVMKGRKKLALGNRRGFAPASSGSDSLDGDQQARAMERSSYAIDFIAAALFAASYYLCGWIQLMAVTGMGPIPAFLTAIAPFIVFDIIKTIIAVITAHAVNKALRL